VRLPDRPLLGVDELVELLRGPDDKPLFGRTALYAALKSGDVPGRRTVGRRVLVCTRDIADWLGADVTSAASWTGGGAVSTITADETRDAADSR
jgi:hypothetical protein